MPRWNRLKLARHRRSHQDPGLRVTPTRATCTIMRLLKVDRKLDPTWAAWAADQPDQPLQNLQNPGMAMALPNQLAPWAYHSTCHASTWHSVAMGWWYNTCSSTAASLFCYIKKLFAALLGGPLISKASAEWFFIATRPRFNYRPSIHCSFIQIL